MPKLNPKPLSPKPLSKQNQETIPLQDLKGHNKPLPSKVAIEQEVREHKAISHWKTKCSELLEALRSLAQLPMSNVAQRVATNAIRKFEETK